MATTLQAQKVRIPVVGFGDRLRRFRLSLGMDQREFADALGGAFSHATLSRYESMEGTPRAAVLVANSVELRYATVIYDSTGDLLALQELLGHSSPETTKRYVRVSMRALRVAASAAS